MLPDQQVVDGEIVLQIVEGRLTSVLIDGNQRLATRYLRSRIEQSAGAPLDVTLLKDRLQLLQQDPHVDQLNATLVLGVKPGEAELHLQVQEARPYQLTAGYDNRRSPSIGANRFGVIAEHDDLSGLGDTLIARWGQSNENGERDYSFSYAVPLNVYDTAVDVRYDHAGSHVIEAPFNPLGINSAFNSWHYGIDQPIYRSLNQLLRLGVAFDHRWTDTFLLGAPYSFTSGMQQGRSVVSVLNVAQNWTLRNPWQVVAFNSNIHVGLDALGSTRSTDGQPDSRYWNWLGQFQFMQLLTQRGDQLLLRASTQLSPYPLLTMEKYSLGGFNTVRGYRENQLVHDNGGSGSVELRIPLLSKREGIENISLALFYDYGTSWDTAQPTQKSQYLSSAGAGLLWDPARQFHAEIYWGNPLRNIGTSSGSGNDLQDMGIHFLTSYQFF